jgi:hypothetical protein
MYVLQATSTWKLEGNTRWAVHTHFYIRTKSTNSLKALYLRYVAPYWYWLYCMYLHTRCCSLSWRLCTVQVPCDLSEICRDFIQGNRFSRERANVSDKNLFWLIEDACRSDKLNLAVRSSYFCCTCFLSTHCRCYSHSCALLELMMPLKSSLNE